MLHIVETVFFEYKFILYRKIPIHKRNKSPHLRPVVGVVKVGQDPGTVWFEVESEQDVESMHERMVRTLSDLRNEKFIELSLVNYPSSGSAQTGSSEDRRSGAATNQLAHVTSPCARST